MSYKVQELLNEINQLKVALAEKDRVIGEAVWALGQLHFYLPKQLDTEASKVQSRITEILDSPEVRDYLERQKEAT